MNFTPQERVAIINEAEGLYLKTFKPICERIMKKELDDDLCCIPMAAALCIILNKRGARPVLQAGSASWQIITDEEDDGKETTATHYSYMFHPKEALPRIFGGGTLPELHAWVALPDTNEIIDATAGRQPAALTKLQNGLRWNPKLHPPSFIWSEAATLADKEQFLYKPHPLACRFAASLAQQIVQEAVR